VLLFSGHGWLDRERGQGFWIPADAEQGDKATYIRNQEVFDELKDIRAHHLLLIVDSCFSGAMFKDLSSPYTAADELDRRPSRRVLTSGLDTRVSDGRPGDVNSPFAAALLQTLRESAGSALTLSQLLPDLRSRTGPGQTPQFRPLDLPGDGLGEFVFYRSSSEAADYEAAEKLDTPAGWRAFLGRCPQTARRTEIEARIRVLEDEAAWQQAQREDSEAAYDRYLDAFPQGKHADEAAGRLRYLGQQSAWEIARQRNTRFEYREFLRLHGGSPFAAEAQAALELLRKQEDLQAEAAQRERERRQQEAQAAAEAGARRKAQVEAAQRTQARLAWLRTYSPQAVLLLALLAGTGWGISWLASRKADEQPPAPQVQAAVPDPASRVQEPVPENTHAPIQDYTETATGIPFTMVRIAAGTFQMGSENGDSDEKPVHQVRVSDFYLGETEVTQAQWRAVMGADPPELRFKGCGQCPVEGVSWEDVQQFIRELNAKTGETYRLPTEAEWEYAAGGGASGRTKWSGTGTESSLGSYAWYSANSDSKTHPVKQKQPNGLGLYDMSGNVWEWCSDWYGSYQPGAQTDHEGPSSGVYRVLRGGGWYDDAGYCRVASRNYYGPGYRYDYYGFRLARQF
jgi:formylglycine-generating enzyme required for sulfatase activity